jgi:hypothetical protein
MRDMGVRGILIYCADYRCSHSMAISADRWPDDVRLSDIEARFSCGVCGKRGADVRPNFTRTQSRSVRGAIGEGPGAQTDFARQPSVPVRHNPHDCYKKQESLALDRWRGRKNTERHSDIAMLRYLHVRLG